MKNSPHSSSASANCRLDWRPSRLLQRALLMLGLLAAASVLASDAPTVLSLPLALIVAVAGWARAAREARRTPVHLHLPGGRARPSVDGLPVRDVRVSRRGPVTVVAWRAARGPWNYRSFWPDTLSAQARRELMLAAGDWRVSPERRSMAT